MSYLSQPKNIQSKLVKAFIFQLLLISIVAVCGVFATKYLLSDLLIRKALEGEARHFWELRQTQPQTPLPNTDNLTGYLSEFKDDASVPEIYRNLPIGLSKLEVGDTHSIVYVEKPPKASGEHHKLFLAFDQESVSRLTLTFGILPLIFVLIALYLMAWFAYRQAHRAISPLFRLSEQVDKMNVSDDAPLSLKLEEFWDDSDVEVNILANALDSFTQRIQTYVDRERLFTRDVSHELRTPIAVLRGSMEVIERKFGDTNGPAVNRMQRTLYDMESLIETLLLLGRGEMDKLPTEPVDVNDVVAKLHDELTLLFKDKPIELKMVAEAHIHYRLPEQVLSMLIGNLMRNACNYTPEGEVTVTVHKNGVSVKDTGVGIDKTAIEKVFSPYYRGQKSKDSKGYGLGLTIVKRLCQRYDLKLRVTSEVGQGTEVFLSLPKARIQ